MLRRCAKTMMTSRPPPVLLFRDHDFLAVDKPPDVRMDKPPLTTSSSPTHEAQTMEELVSASFPLPPPGVWRHCHQLDYSTSGCLLYAANKGAAAGAQHCFESRMTKKTYLALVEGWVDSGVYALPGVTPLGHPPLDTTKVPVPKRFHSQVAGVGKRREAGKLYEEVCNKFREGGLVPPSAVFKLTWHEIKEQAKLERGGEVCDMGSQVPPPPPPPPPSLISPPSGGNMLTYEGVLHELETALLASATPLTPLTVFNACMQYAQMDAERFKGERDASAMSAPYSVCTPHPLALTTPPHFIGALVDLPIAEPREAGSIRMELSPLGKAAQTHIQLLQVGVFKGRKVSKVLLTPISGRRHQLRLHTLALGHPIVGDYTYNTISSGSEEERMMLHSNLLELQWGWMVEGGGGEGGGGKVNKAARTWAKEREERMGGVREHIRVQSGDPFEGLLQ